MTSRQLGRHATMNNLCPRKQFYHIWKTQLIFSDMNYLVKKTFNDRSHVEL